MRFLFAIVAMIAFACFIVVAYKTGFCGTSRPLVYMHRCKKPVGEVHISAVPGVIRGEAPLLQYGLEPHLQ